MILPFLQRRRHRARAVKARVNEARETRLWAGSVVDTDRDEIPLGDEDDATSLMFMLTFSHGVGHMTQVGEGWEVRFGEGPTFTGATQLEALHAARDALGLSITG